MIHKCLINIDNKLILEKLIISKQNNQLLISLKNTNSNHILTKNNIIFKSLDYYNNQLKNTSEIKIPIFNSYDGLNYYVIKLPLLLLIYENKYIFHPYIILSSINIKIDNDFDFFYNLEKILYKKYDLKYFNFKDLIHNYYSYIITYNNLSKNNKLDIIKLYLIYNNSKNYNFYKKISIEFDNFIYYMYPNNTTFKEHLKITDFDLLIYYTFINTKLDNFILSNVSLLNYQQLNENLFLNIIDKYSNNSNQIYNILSILFSYYNYPLINNRREMDDMFDNIIYISLYNRNILFNQIFNINEMYLNIIPFKLKNLYLNLMKTLIQIINNNFVNITYNQKCYNDYLNRKMIKLFLSNSKKKSILLFKQLINTETYEKFKNIFSMNLLLYDLSYKISWITLPTKLNYLEYFYKNNNIIFYQNKINKNIFHESFDIKVKQIIENPLEMYNYLKNEKDFIKWTLFIENNINNLYYTPIKLSKENLISLGKMLYLLYNINNQNMDDSSYLSFINFSILNLQLIIFNSRINLKIRDIFPHLKYIINLGFLAKHLLHYQNNFHTILLNNNIQLNKLNLNILLLNI